ncbi:NAD(P)-dependent oxidoreductase [uncultured Bacteroides sp.]|uniref:NAD-dependent epimerase/dehydratase family protein n=1 Tax=uncultured Bacteroides sp. TaxID=162156 RepID=UPI002AA8C42B|nr:NAD(P)-dependent oxidoreductase [uncultured Bacteroides sp.]
MMKILITGASGFIGTNILEYFLSNAEVLNIDINEPRNKEHIKYWKKIDIKYFKNFEIAVKEFNPEYIVHLAARTDLDGSDLNDYSSNTDGVKNLMVIVKELPNLKKIIITSSMLVCHGGYYPKDQFDYAPTTMYGESKVETEKIVWANKPLCDWAILRPTSIWGPWFDVPYKNFFDLVMSKKYFHIGNKGCTKTYGYVGNAVYQIEKILFSETKDENNKVFFIGDNPATNIEEWGNEIASELGSKIFKMPYLLVKIAALFGDFLKLFGMHFPITSFRLHNMTTDNKIDLTKTFEIAPNPPFTRVQGVKKTIEWLKSHN